MRLRFLICVVATLFWAGPRPLWADPVVISFNRAAIAGAQLGGTFVEDIDRNADVLAVNVSASAGGDAASADASFASHLTSDNQQLSGSAFLTASAARTTGTAVSFSSSQALFEFSIDEPFRYSFFGSVATGVDGNSVWEAHLFDRGAPGFTPLFDYREETAIVRAVTGLLLPGRYEFFVLGRAAAGCGFGGPGDCAFQDSVTNFSFDFRLSPDTPAPVVPEPGTMILLSSGLAGLAAARRRRSRLATGPS